MAPFILRGRRGAAAPSFRSLLLFACCLAATFLLLGLPAHAFVYTTAVSAAQYPATYAAANPSALPMGGLYQACVEADVKGNAANRTVLVIVDTMSVNALAETVTTGQVYLGGFYVAALGPWNGWCWDAGTSTVCPGLFCLEATCERVQNTTYPLAWATGYPVMDTDGTIGSLVYMAYDASLKGWINVDGTAPLDGVACQSVVVQNISKKSSFPWWAILIIVLGSVVVIAVVVTIVVCCCCKKKKRNFDDDDDESSFSSRSGSFVSRGTSYTGSSYTGTTRSSSFSSRGSSYSGTSKSSGATGTTSTSTGTGSSSFSSFSSRGTGTTGTSSYSGSSGSGSTGTTGSSSAASSSRSGSSRGSSSTGTGSTSTGGSSVSSRSTGTSGSSRSTATGSTSTGGSSSRGSSVSGSSRGSTTTGSSSRGSTTTGSSSNASSSRGSSHS